MLKRAFALFSSQRDLTPPEAEALEKGLVATNIDNSGLEGQEIQHDEEIQHTSSQLLAPPPLSKPAAKSKKSKKGKNITTIPEVEKEDYIPRLNSLPVVEIRPGGLTFEDTADVEAEADAELDAEGGLAEASKAPKRHFARDKSGRFSMDSGTKLISKPAKQQDGLTSSLPKNKTSRLAGKETVNGLRSELEGSGGLQSKRSRKPRKIKAVQESVQAGPAYDEVPPSTDYPILDDVEEPPHRASIRSTIKNPSASDVIAPRSADEAGQVSQDDDLQASAQLLGDTPSATLIGEDATPKRPSKKALGKRKAVDIPIDSNRTAKRRKGKVTPNRDIKEMLISVSNPSSRRNSHVSESLEETTINLWRENPVTDDQQSAKTSGSILPSGYTRGMGRKYPTPRGTPSHHIRHVSPAEAVEREGGVANAEEVEEPQEHERQSSPALKLNEKSKRKRLSTVNEPEEVAQTHAPTSNSAKRKRRLPVGTEGESLTVDLQTPRPQSGSRVKISESRTPKPPNTPKTAATPGRLLKEEIEAISAAILHYRDMHDMNQFEINRLVQSSAFDGKDLWKEVCDMVPNLPRQKILNTARRKFHNFEARGTWTEEQDDELRDAYDRFPDKWTQIGQAINRFPEDCRDRWRNYLVYGNTLRKDIWSKEEEEQLKEAVQQSLEELRDYQKNDEEIAEKSLEDFLDFGVVSRKMHNIRSRLQCANKWKQLQDRQISDTSDDQVVDGTLDENAWRAEQAERDARALRASQKLEILRSIASTDAGRARKIPWTAVRKSLGFSTTTLALKTLFRDLRRRVSNNKELRLKDILKVLIDSFEIASPNEPSEYKESDPIPEKKTRRRRSASSTKPSRTSEKSERSAKLENQRKRREFISEEIAIDEPEDEDLDNGEGPSNDSRSDLISNSISDEPNAEELLASSSTRTRSTKSQVIDRKGESQPELENALEQSNFDVIVASARKASDNQVLNDELEQEPARVQSYTTPLLSQKTPRSKAEKVKSLQGKATEEPAPKRKNTEFKTARQVFLEEAAENRTNTIDDDGKPFAIPKRRKPKSKKDNVSGGQATAQDPLDASMFEEMQSPKPNSGSKGLDSQGQVEAEEVGPISSLSSSKKRRKSKQKTIEKSEVNNGEHGAALERRKKKRRERLQILRESQNRDTIVDDHASTQDTSQDWATGLDSLKNGKAKSRKSRSKTSKKSDPFGEVNAVDSDGERELAAVTVPEPEFQRYEGPSASKSNAEEFDAFEFEDLKHPDAANNDLEGEDIEMSGYIHEKYREDTPYNHLTNGAKGSDDEEEIGNLPHDFHLERRQYDECEVNGYHSGEDELETQPFDGHDLEYPSTNEERVSGQDEEDYEHGQNPDLETMTVSDHGYDDGLRGHNGHNNQTNGFHSIAISDGENTPTRYPSPDLDTPQQDDGRRTSRDTPAKFGMYQNHSRRRSPSISSGSDTSIPARVDRARELSEEL